MTNSQGSPTTAPLEDLLRTPLDPLLADAARLRAMAALIGLPAEGRIGFVALRRLLGLTDGNLGRHLQVLVEMGYADVSREYHGRRPHSLYAATMRGRAAFAGHVAALEAIIAAARGA